jgi:hypothetical protein
MQEYANNIGADFVVLDGHTQDWPYYEKFRIQPWVKAYKRTLFIDADVIVDPNAPNIFDEVPPDLVGAFCDYQFNFENMEKHNDKKHIERFVEERRNVIRSFIKNDDKYSKYVTSTEKDTLINSGVVVCSNQHADIWNPVDIPCAKYKLTEQFLVEMRIITKHGVHKLPFVWNCQPWFPDDIFFKEPRYFTHLAGWSDIQPWLESKIYLWSGYSRLEIINKIINEKSVIPT